MSQKGNLPFNRGESKAIFETTTYIDGWFFWSSRCIFFSPTTWPYPTQHLHEVCGLWRLTGSRSRGPGWYCRYDLQITYTAIGSMGRTVYLPTFTHKFKPNVGKYTVRPMDPIWDIYIYVNISPRVVIWWRIFCDWTIFVWRMLLDSEMLGAPDFSGKNAKEFRANPSHGCLLQNLEVPKWALMRHWPCTSHLNLPL